MLINWFTVFAQIINFIILVFLLKRFLYGPIIRAMEQREKKIAAAMERAEKAEKEARLHSAELAKEKQDFAAAKERLLAEARQEIETWRESTLGSAREEIERMRQTWVDALNQEKQVFLNTLKTRIVDQVVLISRKALQDLANGKLEKQVIKVFIQHMENEENRSQLKDLSVAISVKSGFQLDDEDSGRLREQLAQWFPQSKTLEFELAEELGIGIQVLAGDRKVEWNLSNYLDDLEQEILTGLFDRKGQP
ncbi:F0F1 ATP synthase subunit B [Thermodesulfobacteriota bacterium]